MQIAIIGDGRMGKWLANHFRKHDVKLYGKKDSLAGISSFDAIVIAVSLDQMPHVTKKLGKVVKPRQLVWDIASIKSHFIKEFRKLGCRKASVHPMFGPSATSMKNQNIILISDVGNKEDRKEVLKFFPGAKILHQTAKKHDEIMAYVLCLPYFVNLAFRDIIKNRFDKYSGPSFRSQKQLADKILGSGVLVTDIINLNPYATKVLNELIKSLKRFK